MGVKTGKKEGEEVKKEEGKKKNKGESNGEPEVEIEGFIDTGKDKVEGREREKDIKFVDSNKVGGEESGKKAIKKSKFGF